MSMVRSKRKWKCSKCGQEYIKWTGICYRGCNFSGTVEEVPLSKPAAKTPLQRNGTGTTGEAKRLRRRAKDSERDIAKRMLVTDGPDPAFRNIASSTGRIGHITGMRIDAISRSYVTENKNRKMPSWLVAAWMLINQRAVDFNKNALLHVDPPNMPKTYPIQGGARKLDTMAIITQTRHEELIHNERLLQKLLHEISSKREYMKLYKLYEELDKDTEAQ